MNVLKTVSLAAIAAISTSAMAATFELNTDQPIDFNEYFVYPNLQFGQITDAKLIAEGSDFYSATFLDLFTLSFENAPSITVRNLKQTSETDCGPNGSSPAFYGEVANQWVFRKIGVTVCPMNEPDGIRTGFKMTVVDSDNYVGSNAPSFDSVIVAEGATYLKDTTPNKVTDIVKTNVESKSLRLSLLQKPANVEIDGFPRFGFVVNAAWLGFGDKTLVLEESIYADPAKVKSVTLLLTTESFPEGDVQFLAVRYEDESGLQQETNPVDLRFLLEQSYGPVFQP